MSEAKQLEHIERFTVKSINGFDATCDLRIYQNERGQIVVIASEIINPDGSYIDCVSVTNAVEDLATAVRVELGYNFDFWIEHYPQRGRLDKLPENFDLVLLRYKEKFWMTTPGRRRDYYAPKWQHVVREIVEHLIEQDLDIPEPEL